MTALTFLPLKNPRTIVYVDGFNLYYGGVRNTPNKWLDLSKYFRLIRPDDNILLIRYFTSLVTGPDASQPRGLSESVGDAPGYQDRIRHLFVQKGGVHTPHLLAYGQSVFQVAGREAD